MKNKSDDYWKDNLTQEQYRVLRRKGTESYGSGLDRMSLANGILSCVGCGQELFDASELAHDDVGTLSGWPGFRSSLPGAVEYSEDNSGGMDRTEITCSKCGGHLGHVFDIDQDKKHYCVNSVCLQEENK